MNKLEKNDIEKCQKKAFLYIFFLHSTKQLPLWSKLKNHQHPKHKLRAKNKYPLTKNFKRIEYKNYG